MNVCITHVAQRGEYKMDTRWIWATVTYFARLYLAMAVGCATSIKRSMLRFLGEASVHMLSVQIFKER